MKPNDKPLWYDVYEAFPPKYEPFFGRPAPKMKIRQIFYPEDVIRAQFYKKYGSQGTARLSDKSSRPTVCQLFVKEYERLQADGNIPEDQLMQEAALALEARGIYLDRSRVPPKVESSELRMDEERLPSSNIDSEKLSLAEIFKNSQADESK
ncbi:small ribosomal subunit protein mS23 isoform X2 [Procambarus clarkii]|nr:28S ribosomal protein S23, mitochondrial-like isoform X2 [Procambarus clarkii]